MAMEYDEAVLRKMFANPRDRASRAWVLTDSALEPLRKIPHAVSTEGRTYYIFNEFGDRQPYVYNYDYFHFGRNNVNFAPSVICDSNVASLLHRSVVEPAKMSKADYSAAHELLKLFILHEVDFNSSFYLLEAAAKVSLEGFELHARAVDRSFLILHSMDRERFLATGEIQESIARKRLYQNQFGAIDFDVIADRRFRRIAPRPHTPHCDYIYANLLQMVLLHKGETKAARIEEKLRLLRASMVELGMVSARELLMAPDYFAGLIDGFIPFQPRSNFARQQLRLRATAWDLYLLTVPATLLGSGDQDEAMLAMICTGDKAFAKVGKKFTLESVLALQREPLMPAISYDCEHLRARIGTKRFEAIQGEALDFGRRRAAEHHPRLPLTDIAQVIQEREIRLSALCR